MLKIMISLMAVTLLTLSAAPLLKTGQMLSYGTDGNIVTDGSVKDDGYYQEGEARSYSHSGNTVIDSATGLQWQDNETKHRRWVTYENHTAGNYNDTSGETATTYCSDLTLDGYMDWRLPSIEELGTLLDDSRSIPPLSEGVFTHYSSNYYWSATSNAESNNEAWTVRFTNGFSSSQAKKNDIYVRCVRGGQLDRSNLSRSNDIVRDSTTRLLWQDNAAIKTATRSWADALDYCESLSLDDKSNWRLPNKNELLSIADRSRYSPALDISVFQNYSLYNYWASTT